MSKPQFGPRASFLPKQELSFSWFDQMDARLQSLSTFQRVLLGALVTGFILVNVTFFRLAFILNRDKPTKRPRSSSSKPSHLVIVLGSGGHTAEMFNILHQLPTLIQDYTKRTYIVSSGDGFSASKAAEFEKQIGGAGYDIVTVTRARRVHQSILTTPYSALRCLSDSINVLSRDHPDLILTNGPGTGVCVVTAAIILLFFKGEGRGQMRSIFIESWARVKTLSLSGKILKPFVDRFLVQWPELVSKGDRVEYIGPLVR